MKKSFLLLLILSVQHQFLSAQTCLSEGISISVQSEIDQFATNYPGCTEILGNVTISGAGINDLSGLSQIQKVKQLDITNCGNLSNLIGLEGLNEIDGRFILLNIPQITSLNELSALELIKGQFIVSLNTNLISLDGLQNLNEIGSFIQISENNNLQNLNGIGNLDVLTGSFTVYSNPELTALVNFPNIENIGGSFQINNNAKLTEISGFPNLEFIIGRMKIFDNLMLESILGFDKLFALGEELLIYNNAKLTDLNGFLSLENINGALELYDNHALSTLSGLDNIDPSKIQDLKIENSTLLSDCDIASICDYLENGGSNSISGNAQGCNSESAVIAACNGTSSIDESQKIAGKYYPNPVSDKLYIQYPEPIDKLELIDLFGNIVYLSNAPAISFIPMSHLASGTYFLKLWTNHVHHVVKISKQ